MKAVRLTGIREFRIEEVPDPVLKNENDVLIRMDTVGVCGSDVHYYKTGRIGSRKVRYPFTIGHECSGVVEQAASGVSRVKTGDRVAVDPSMPCWQCDQCKTGRPHTCRNLRFLGCPGEAEGCLSELIVLPEDSCYGIPENMTMEQATVSEPLSIGVYSVKQSIPMKGAKIGILGMGPIGTSVLLPAKAWGAGKAYVTDKIDARLELARKAGADWAGNPDRQDVVQEVSSLEPLLLDAVFECCGEQEAIDQAISLLKPGGKLLIVGIPAAFRISFDIDEMRHKEICIQNVRRQVDCVQPALEMITDGEINVDSMVTHRFPFARTKEAFDLAADYRDGVLKALIKVR